MQTALTFKPIRNETVVVMRGDKVAGTIRRYRVHKGCLVHVPGLLDSSSARGSRFFRTIDEAKAAILAADEAARPFVMSEAA